MNITKHILNRLKSVPFISTTYERLIGNKKKTKKGCSVNARKYKTIVLNI